MGVTDEAYRLDKTAAEAVEKPVSCYSSCLTVGGVQVRASQGRRGRDTGSYHDRGERREVRAWASPRVKRLG